MLPIEVIVVLVLAAYRATRFATADSISAPLRARLYRWAWNDDDGRAPEPIPRGTVRGWCYELLTCPLCLGVWMSALLYALWIETGFYVRAGIVVLAVAGAQCVLARYDNDVSV